MTCQRSNQFSPEYMPAVLTHQPMQTLNAVCCYRNRQHEIHFKRTQFGKVSRKFMGVEGNMTDPMT